MNTVHKTASGTATLANKEWRDGGFPQARAGVACITVHDDVTNAVWKFTGRLHDAAEVIGRLYVQNRERVAVLSGNHIEIETPETDMWRGVGQPDEDGNYDDYEFDHEAYPNVVAY